LSQFEVPKTYKNLSDLSTGVADIISEFYLYLLKVSGQREFLQNFVHLALRAARLIRYGPQRLAIFSKRATGFLKLFGILSICHGASVFVAGVLVRFTVIKIEDEHD
jgi:hypothetical protein